MSSTEPGGRSGHRGDVRLRKAEPSDADSIAGLYGDARRAAVPAMPPALHTGYEDRAWMADRLVDGRHEAWVAEDDQALLGYALFTQEWLDHLFVHPDATGDGIGSALLDVVKRLRPDGFSLWVFQTNRGARRFYARHGLVELERTAGERNEERAPDLRMAWPGRDPVAFLRAQIDEVDTDLAWVVSRRVALTAATQRYKAVGGHAGRDVEREAEIARRLAAASGGTLDERAWRRILHEIISVSLDVAHEET